MIGWIWLLTALAGSAAAGPGTFENPILASGPDPWIWREGRVYYFLSTQGNRIDIRAANSLGGIRLAQPVTVWKPPVHGPNAVSIWAPELHRIGGKWFIYYTAAQDGADDDVHRRIFVLENDGNDPLKGKWLDRGPLKTAHAGIDGTTFEHNGQRYFVYSAYIGAESDLVIVRMANPWTLVGPEQVIARPDRDWERQGGRAIVEGPEFLEGPKGDLFITYSGSACWSDDYAIGLLRAASDADPLSANAWAKETGPVFSKSTANGVYAPGHNGFFQSSDRKENWIVYHANDRAGMGCSPARSPRAQRFDFDARGFPTFGPPVASSTRLAEPEGGKVGRTANQTVPSEPRVMNGL